MTNKVKLGCSYFGNRILRYVKKDMEFLAKNSFDYVVHTFSENDLAFYHKTMEEIVKATHNAGLQVHIDPWGVGKIFGGEAFSEIISQKPRLREILSDNEPAGIACLNHPEFRDFMKGWIKAAVETGADVIFWDEPHFYLPHWMGGRPNTWGCRCNFCKDKYHQRYGEELPQIETEQVIEFKQNSIKDFLSEMISYVKSFGIKNALCSLPADSKSIKNWESLVYIDGLDIFGTDPYWYIGNKNAGEYVGFYSREVVKLTKKASKKSEIWIQGFKIPKGKENEIAIAVESAVQSGVEYLAVWGFEACAAISYIRADNPKKAWKILLNAFKKAKNI